MLQECAQLRRKLNNHIEASTHAICDHLNATFEQNALNNMEPDAFWRISVNKIYRTRLSRARGPLLREFAMVSANDGSCKEPIAAPPECEALSRRRQSLRSHAAATLRSRDKFRRKCVRRTMHRLVNTRLLRGGMALAGVYGFTSDDVVAEEEDDDDGEDWSPNELEQFRRAEERMLLRLLPFEAAPGVESREWWEASCDDEGHTRAQCFPHLSQRALFSKNALLALTNVMILAGAGDNRRISMVDVCEEHVKENLVSAVRDAIEE